VLPSSTSYTLYITSYNHSEGVHDKIHNLLADWSKRPPSTSSFFAILSLLDLENANLDTGLCYRSLVDSWHICIREPSVGSSCVISVRTVASWHHSCSLIIFCHKKELEITLPQTKRELYAFFFIKRRCSNALVTPGRTFFAFRKLSYLVIT